MDRSNALTITFINNRYNIYIKEKVNRMKEKDVALAMEACNHLEACLPVTIKLLKDFLYYTEYSEIPKPDFFIKALTKLEKIKPSYISGLYFHLQEEYIKQIK